MISKLSIIVLCAIGMLCFVETLSPEQQTHHPINPISLTNYRTYPYPIPVIPHHPFTKSMNGNLVLPVYINDGKPVAEFIPPVHPEDQFPFPADK